MALSTQEENIMELVNRSGGAGRSFDVAAIMRALGQRKLAARKYKEEREEDIRERNRQFGLQERNMALREEMAEVDAAYKQGLLSDREARTKQAEVAAKYGMEQPFYETGTPGSRSDYRGSLIEQGLIDPALQQELMVNPNRRQYRDEYPAAQASLYGPLLNYERPEKQQRIVNAPTGTKPIKGGANLADAYWNLKAMQGTHGPSDEFFRQQADVRANRPTSGVTGITGGAPPMGSANIPEANAPSRQSALNRLANWQKERKGRPFGRIKRGRTGHNAFNSPY